MPTPPQAPWRRRLERIDAVRHGLLADLVARNQAQLMQSPGGDRWSVLQIVEHMILAEQAILLGLPPLTALEERPRTLRNRLLYGVVVAVLRFRIRVKVPSRRMVPTGQLSLESLKPLWEANHQWLRGYTASLSPGGEQAAVFRHPVAGPISLAQALRLDELHLDIHVRQIRTLLSPASRS